MIWALIFVVAIATQDVTAQKRRQTSTTQSSVDPQSKKTDEQIQKGIADFTVKFNKYIKEGSSPEQNILFSPINLYTALGLMALGTNGETRLQIGTAMGFKNLTGTYVHKGLQRILGDFKKTNITKVEVGNGLFVQEGFPLSSDYAKEAKKLYESEVRNLDFQSDQEGSVKLINNWVSEKTKGKIPELFKEPFSTDTQIVLGSCLYFNGKWKNGFPKERTKQGYFNKEKATMMNNQAFVPYMDNTDLEYEAISLTYEDDFAMYILLPYENNTIETLSSKFDSQAINYLLDNISNEYLNVNYTVPKMKFDWKKDVSGELSKLGVKTLFENPTFKYQTTDASKAKSIKVSQVSHATEIEVEETGTTAVATTFFVEALSLGPSIPPRTVIFNVDKPFMFFIAHKKNKMILFAGTVFKP